MGKGQKMPLNADSGAWGLQVEEAFDQRDDDGPGNGD